MLQRYHISMDSKANRLSIEEFSILGRIPRKPEYFESNKEKYSFIHKVTYDGDVIRAAINEGKETLVSELRSDAFFPIRSCVEMIAEKVIELFEDDSEPFHEVFFNDLSLFDTEDENV